MVPQVGPSELRKSERGSIFPDPDVDRESFNDATLLFWEEE